MTTIAADAGELEPARAAAEPIPADKSRSLRRWNRFLTGAHGVQFIVMIAISSTAALFEPVVPTIRPIIEDGQFTGVEPSSVTLFSIPLAYVIASFFLMSAIAHAAAGWFLRGRYEAWLARGMNPLRWVEYAFSSTVMIVAIAYISYITDFPALIAIAGTNVAMNLFGWSMEAANEGRLEAGKRIDWKHFIFGCIAGITPVDRDLLDHLGLFRAGGPARRRRHPGLRLRDHRQPVRRLQHLRHHDGAAVPPGRTLARVPLRREDLHDPEPGREVAAGLAGLVRHAAAVSSDTTPRHQPATASGPVASRPARRLS